MSFAVHIRVITTEQARLGACGGMVQVSGPMQGWGFTGEQGCRVWVRGDICTAGATSSGTNHFVVTDVPVASRVCSQLSS